MVEEVQNWMQFSACSDIETGRETTTADVSGAIDVSGYCRGVVEATENTGDKPPSSGQMILSEMLESLSVTVRPEPYVVVSLSPDVEAPAVGGDIGAVIEETEGITVVATLSRAAHEPWPHDFVASWLTLDVHSALEAVGLTAAFSRQLGRAGIPCNVIAGFFHDHILVPVDKTDAAVEVLEALANSTN